MLCLYTSYRLIDVSLDVSFTALSRAKRSPIWEELDPGGSLLQLGLFVSKAPRLQGRLGKQGVALGILAKVAEVVKVETCWKPDLSWSMISWWPCSILLVRSGAILLATDEILELTSYSQEHFDRPELWKVPGSLLYRMLPGHGSDFFMRLFIQHMMISNSMTPKIIANGGAINSDSPLQSDVFVFQGCLICCVWASVILEAHGSTC